MLDLNGWQWVVVVLAAALIGLAKAGLVGANIPAIPLLALVMPARASVGFLLPLLVVGDVFAVIYWRRHAEWKRLALLLPWTLAGVGLGALLMRRLTNELLSPILGGMVLVLVAVILQPRCRRSDSLTLERRWKSRLVSNPAGPGGKTLSPFPHAPAGPLSPGRLPA